MAKVYAGVFKDNGRLRLRASTARNRRLAKEGLKRLERPADTGCQLLGVHAIEAELVDPLTVDELVRRESPELLERYGAPRSTP